MRRRLIAACWGVRLKRRNLALIATCVLALATSAAEAQTSAQPLVNDVMAQLNRDYRQGGALRVNATKNECVERARNGRGATHAERCLVYVYAAHLLDDAMTGHLRFPSTPGLSWDDVYPDMVRMFDLMRVPVASRQVYLNQYKRSIEQSYR